MNRWRLNGRTTFACTRATDTMSGFNRIMFSISILILGPLAMSCAVKNERATPVDASSINSASPNSESKDIAYFGWMELYYAESDSWSGTRAGTRLSPLGHQSRFSRAQFASASLETGINLEQYQKNAQENCATVPSSEKKTCEDLVKRMHGLCAKTVGQYKSTDSGRYSQSNIACKMWVLSSGTSEKSSCMELDNMPTGQIEFKDSGSTSATVRFVDVPIGGGSLASDPPSCVDALEQCNRWLLQKPDQRSCAVQGWGVYRMK